MSAPGQEFIAIREFAKREGCDEKQIRRALEKGLLFRNDAGLLDAAQVGNGWRKTNRRGRETAAQQGADNSADISESVRTNVRRESVRTDESPAQAAERIALTAAPFDRAEAERIKENYLALLRKLEYEQKSDALIELEVAERILFEQARAQRDAWLNWPTRVGPLLAAELGLEADRVTGALTEYVHRHISQLGEPETEVEFTGEN